jgi:hypothetical protein
MVTLFTLIFIYGHEKPPNPDFPVCLRSIRVVLRIDNLVKSHEFNYRWLSKKVHIQGVEDGTFYDAIKY